MDQEIRSEVDQACKVAEDFTKHYYESLDKRRHLINRLYLETAVLVWNGTGASGKENIGKFLMDLPISEHIIWSLDAQKVPDQVLSKMAFLIKVTGNAKFQTGATKAPRPFCQTFMVTAQDDKWKIVTDCYRFQELAA